MEDVNILYNLIGFLVDQKMENIKSDIGKNQLIFTKDGKEYILKLTEKTEN